MCAALAGVTGDVSAQAYPSKPIRLIVPFPAGTTDSVSRILAARLSGNLGQPVIVENRPGASGNIGTEMAVKAPADGYTMVMASNSLATAPILQRELPFDPARDLVPIALVATAPSVLVTHSSSPYRTISELVAYVKARPGEVTYASSGNATLGHLLGEWFKAEAGIDLVHVPYKGGGPALTDVLAGRVGLLFDVLLTTLPNVKAGRIRALAITSSQRSPMLPETPTMVEAGYPGFQGTAWFGILAPAATPKDIVERLSNEITRVLQTPEVRRDLGTLGMTPEGGTSEQFSSWLRNESAKWSRIIKNAKIRAD